MNKANQQASVKAIEETCVTCHGPHPYYECLATDNKTFNASAATGTYNQGGNGYRPQGDPKYHASNQIGPTGFPPSNVQNNQNYNRYNQNQGNYQALNTQGFNQQRGQNFNQGNNNYQAPVGPSNELSNYMKSNEATLRAMQTQMTNMKIELRNNFKSTIDTRTNKIENQNNQRMNILTNLTMQRQSPSGLRSLPSNTIANPRDPSTESNIKTIDPILEKFTDEPALGYIPLPRDDDNDDYDLFDLKSDNDEWKKLFNSTLPKESSESSKIATLSLPPFINEDKEFNPGIHILGRTQILKDESKDKDLKDKNLILEDRDFLSISSDQEVLFFLELTVIETLLSFSFENEDKVHIEVLSVLWGNRLLIPEGSLPLSSDRGSVKGRGLSFLEFLLAKYGEVQKEELIWDNRLVITFGHTKVSERVKKALLKTWLLDCFKDDLVKDPHTRSFDDYKWMFDLEIDQLADEYELGIGKKGHMLDDIWKNYKKVQGDNTYWWHDPGSEEKERGELRINIEEYDPPMVHVESFKIKKYSFNSGQNFICVTKELMDALPLGR
nr:reverse transcriptase domain-containing protein [Tanacetum cinerariifolium]